MSKDGIEADPAKVRAIAEFPKPSNITELRSFMGLVTQLGSFSAEISQAAVPLRDLLKTKNQFIWIQPHDQAFQAVKAALVSPPVLTTFD